MREHWRRTHERPHARALRRPEGDLNEILAGCGITATDDLLCELATHEFANWVAGVRPFDDVAAELARFRAAGIQLAIVSNASCEAGVSSRRSAWITWWTRSSCRATWVC